ncbi:aromatic amino acid lyase [Pseudomonas sp. B22129]|uniref:aromatic amino acid lyase n=1 Tax=Pseudomonas sp. B22129 TaxID=3235111 RepID=UPI0037832B03
MIELDPQGLTLAGLLAIARQDSPAEFTAQARQRIDDGHRLLLKLVAGGTPIYGVTTGLGAAVDTPVAPVQASIPLGRAVGVGRLANRQELRAITAARLAGLAQGRSGISPTAADALLALLNSGIEPEVPLLGSLGESDLAPLAHLSLALSVPLTGKDGLALVSANAASVGLGALLVAEAQQVLHALLSALAL